MMESNLIVRNRHNNQAPDSTLNQSRTRQDDTFILEWSIARYKRVSPFEIRIDFEVEANWHSQELRWNVCKSSKDIYRTFPLGVPSNVSSSSKSNEDFCAAIAAILVEKSATDPTRVIQLMEASRWTFARESIYSESSGPKLKEGDLVKASGGYESYNRSRARVLLLQFTIVLITLVGFFLSNGHQRWLTFGLLGISALSFAHWSYFRLSGIDATCILPCLFLPPVGPILIIVWTLVSYVFEKRDNRWFILRQGHLEMYESWGGLKREPVGVFLLDRQTKVESSKLFATQFTVSTPYRTLRLWATSRAERDDWVDKLEKCIVIETALQSTESGQAISPNHAYSNMNFDFEAQISSPSRVEIDSSFAPVRDRIPCEYYIDGRSFFSAALKAISAAQKQVFIAGWMLSPEMYLLRDGQSDDESSIIALPEKPYGLFNFSSPNGVLVELGCPQEYVVEPSVDGNMSFVLVSYELIAPPSKVQATTTTNEEEIKVISWELKGRLASSGQWMELDRRDGVDMSEWDALEPVRFELVSIKRRVCDALEFIFYLAEDEEDPVRNILFVGQDHTVNNNQINSNKNGDNRKAAARRKSMEEIASEEVARVTMSISHSDLDDDENDASYAATTSPTRVDGGDASSWVQVGSKLFACGGMRLYVSQSPMQRGEDSSSIGGADDLSSEIQVQFSRSNLDNNNCDSKQNEHSMVENNNNNEEDGQFYDKAFGMLSRTSDETRMDELFSIFSSRMNASNPTTSPQSNLHSSSARKSSLNLIEEEEELEEDDDPPTKRGFFQRVWNNLSLWNPFALSDRTVMASQHDTREGWFASYQNQTDEIHSLNEPLISNTMSSTSATTTLLEDGMHSKATLNENNTTEAMKKRREWTQQEIFHSRLDRLIARKVLDGVKFHILLYRDVEMFLPNASFSAKRKLLTKALYNRNLQIMRHAPEGRTYGSVQHCFTCSLSRGKTWWSHHEKVICVDQSVAFVGGLDLAMGRFDDRNHSLFDTARRVWKGKDFYNPFKRDFYGLDRDAYSDILNRNAEEHRMPWHDVHLAVGGAAAVDVSRHFVGRWNAVKRELKYRDDRFDLLVPRYPAAVRSRSTSRSIRHVSSSSSLSTTISTSKQALNAREGNMTNETNVVDVIFQSREYELSSCQVVRSVSPWSSPGNVEHSILDAYLNLIANAKESIYIEQQFFCSGLAGTPVKNQIAKALGDRLIKAIRGRERFKCIVVIPLLPAFEGQLKDNYSARSVLHWNLRTIRGLLSRVSKETGLDKVPRSYLGFFTLRSCAVSTMSKRIVTEQIYVHSKVLIVDDAVAVVGSANLNDRSMLGTRDSEVALIISNSPVPRRLRMDLFAEHAGTIIASFHDPTWDDIARANTQHIQSLFPQIPSNVHPTLEQLPSSSYPLSTTMPSLEHAWAFVRKLKGHLTEYPVDFLSKERYLLPRVVRLEREGAVPFENFT